MQRIIYATIAGMILAMMFTGCGGGGGGITITPAALKSIAVTPSGPSIAPLTTTQLTAWGTYSNGRVLNLTTSATWTSSDANIAGINASGLATAGTSTGSTVITAVYSGMTGSTLLTTSETVSLALSPPTPKSLAPGMMQQFSALGTLANSATQFLTSWATWASSNESAATISTSGLASAVAAPDSTIISATFSSITGSVTLTTSPVATISTSPSTASIADGTLQQYTASGTLVDLTQHDLTTLATWSSSNTAVATISNLAGSKGLVTSQTTGTTFITAMFNTIVSNPVSTLVVTPAVLASIVTTPAITSIPDGKTLQYTAIGKFTDNSTQDITATATWTSTNTAVATISNVAGSKGLASSLAEGMTTIRAALSGITSNNATLTITSPALLSIEVTPTSASIKCFPGAPKQFTAMGIYTDGIPRDLTKTANWVSSNTNIATVANGLATTSCIVTGITNITAEVSGITSDPATLTVSF